MRCEKYRDALIALARGESDARDRDEARAHLDTFIRYQRPSGELPVRIGFIGHLLGPYYRRLSNPSLM